MNFGLEVETVTYMSLKFVWHCGRLYVWFFHMK